MDEQNPVNPLPDQPRFWQKLLFWKNFVSALPLFLLAAAYMVPYSRLVTLLELGHGRLGRLMEIEFLVIHSFPFLVIIGLLRPETKKLRIIRTLGFWGLLAIYIIFAFTMDGWAGIFTFTGLTLVTYVGFFLRITEPKLVAQLVVRWFVNFILFLLFVGIMKMPESVERWHSYKQVYDFGLSYFFCLGAIEWSGFYQGQWITDAGDRIIKEYQAYKEGLRKKNQRDRP